MISTSIEGVYEWQIKNTVTGEITGRGRAKNKIHPKMFYYSFPKPGDLEHLRHHRGAKTAIELNQFGLSNVRLNPDEYINCDYSQEIRVAPKTMNHLRLSTHSRNDKLSIEQNDSGEWCFTFKYTRVFSKGEAGTYVAICGGHFDADTYYGSLTIRPNLFSVVNLDKPITLNDIDELTVTYVIYQKCPSITEPITKTVNISGKEYTISILIHPPEGKHTWRTTMIGQNLYFITRFWEQEGIFSNRTIYPRLSYPTESNSTLKLVGNSGSVAKSEFGDYFSMTHVANVSEPYPTTHVKNKMRVTVPYATTGKLDVLRLLVFGSVLEVKITPTLEKTDEEQIFLDWIITHEVPNAPE